MCGHSPLMTCQSEWQTPLATSLTRTWVGPVSGSSNASIRSGVFGWYSTAAFMADPPLFGFRFAHSPDRALLQPNSRNLATAAQGSCGGNLAQREEASSSRSIWANTSRACLKAELAAGTPQ